MRHITPVRHVITRSQLDRLPGRPRLHPSGAHDEVLDRARAADPRFDVTDDNAEDVARICRRLEGVPLAIELAAARIRALPPSAMLARLDHVLPLLVTASRDVPERQRTIQATVEWSIDLLGADARALFERLGVFSGAFSLDAAEAVLRIVPASLAAARAGEEQQRARFRSGLVSAVEVTAATAALAQAESENAIAAVNLWRAAAELDAAQGDLGRYQEQASGR